MRLRYLLVAIAVFLPLPLASQELTASDSTAILGAMERWEEGWRVKDAVLASEDYSDQADWTNAFGMRRIGKPAIRQLLSEVFELPFVMAGDTEYEYHALQALGPDIALLRSRAIRTGQQLPDGTVEEPRRTNHLRVFKKTDGAWRIVSHLIGDERTPGQPR